MTKKKDGPFPVTSASRGVEDLPSVHYRNGPNMGSRQI